MARGSFLNWRLATFCAMLLVVVEGAIRKWLLPQTHEVVYLAKDAVLTVAYALFAAECVIRHRRPIPRWSINPILAVVASWVVVEALNPNLPDLRVGAFGLKAYCYYMPLAYLVAGLYRTKDDLMAGLVLLALSSIPVSLLGVVQFFSPLDSRLVTYLQWEEGAGIGSVSLVGSSPRISGTFSFISGYVVYLFVVILILFGLLNTTGRLPHAPRAVYVLALVLAVANLFMTGSRGPFLTMALVVPFGLVLVRRLFAAPLLVYVPRLGWRAVAVLLAVWLLFGSAVSAFVERARSSGDVGYRIFDTLTTPFLFAEYAGLGGYGAASTHQATRILVQDIPEYSWLPTTDFEEEPERVMLELGVIGFALFYLLKVALTWSAWRTAHRLRDPDLRVIAVSVCLIQIGLLLSPVVFNVTAAFYYWFFAGFALLLPRLDRREGSARSARG